MLQDATQVGVGNAPVEAAAWAVLLGGILLTVLWVRQLFA